jgi:hypothetical protein
LLERNHFLKKYHRLMFILLDYRESFIIEMKGREDPDVPFKDRAAKDVLQIFHRT